MRSRRKAPSPPRVSVICIFYNEERFIGEAVGSVLAQHFEDFELLLVDDGSTDASTRVAKEFASKDPRVRYLDHPGHANRGMSATRNLGVAEARGEFIAFIDADDRWRPEKLAEQVELLGSLPDIDALGGSVNYWSAHAGGKDRLVPTGHVQNRKIAPREATVNMYPLGKADAPSMSDLLFRRDSILRAGGFEEAYRGAYEDQAFLGKFYLTSTLYFTDRLWSDYRIHDGSCMAEVQRGGTYGATRKRFLEWFRDYLHTSAAGSDPLVQEALERALRPYQGARALLKARLRAVPFARPLARAARHVAARLRTVVAPGPAILMYHRIADESFDPWQLAVSPTTFGEHLEWIARNRVALPLEEFAELNAKRRLPSNAIAITFDDAYACSGEAAAPLLHQFGIPATIFVSPGLIDAGLEFWWDDLERIVLGHRGTTLRVEGREIEVGERTDIDGKWPQGQPPRTPRQHAYKALWATLYGRPPREIERIVGDLRRQAGVSDAPRLSHRSLSPAEIRNIASDLVAFGSHALSHPSLPRLDPQDQLREIEESVDRCTRLSGRRPTTFAYPFGDHAPSLEPIVERAGFICACKADGSFVRKGSNPYALPRIFVGNVEARQLALQLGRP